jgi:hypothetical protein
MPAACDDSVKDDAGDRKRPKVLGELQCHDAVVGCCGEVGEDGAILGKRRQPSMWRLRQAA